MKKRVTKDDTITIVKMKEKGLSYNDIVELTGFTYKQIKDCVYRHNNQDRIRYKACLKREKYKNLKQQEDYILEELREEYSKKYPANVEIKSDGILKREMIFNAQILDFQRLNEFIAGKNVFDINISKFTFGKNGEQERFVTIVTYWDK